VVSKSKRWGDSTPRGIPPCFDLDFFGFLGAFVISSCTANISLYKTGLKAMGEAVIAETVRVAGMLGTSVEVGVMERSRGRHAPSVPNGDSQQASALGEVIE